MKISLLYSNFIYMLYDKGGSRQTHKTLSYIYILIHRRVSLRELHVAEIKPSHM